MVIKNLEMEETTKGGIFADPVSAKEKTTDGGSYRRLDRADWFDGKEVKMIVEAGQKSDIF